MSGNTEPMEQGNDGNPSAMTDDVYLLNAPVILKKFGNFQIRSILLLCPSSFFIGLLVVTPVFLNLVPGHQCRIPQSNLSLDFDDAPLTNDVNDSLTIVDADENQCFRFKQLSYGQANTTSENFVKEKCSDGWNFSKLDGNTVVSQFGLVCESAWKRPFTISTVMMGMMIGGIFGGKLSDKYGRRCICLIGNIILCSMTLVASFSFHYWFYIFVLFLIGIAQSLFTLVSFTWNLELVSSANMRTLASLINNTSYAFGGMATSLVAYLVPDWDWMFRVLSLFALVCLFTTWLAPESPVWLLQSNNKKKAAKLMKTIAKSNKIPIHHLVVKPQDGCKNQKNSETIAENEKNVPAKLLFQNSTLRRRLIFCCILRVVSFVCYNTMVYNVSNLGESSHINNVVGCGFDILAVFSMTALMKKLGRKNTVTLALGITGIMCAVTPIVKQEHQVVGTVFASVGRMFATTATLTSFIYASEVFPTLLRTTSAGIEEMLARVTSISIPFLIFAGEEVDLSLPFYVLSGLAFISVYVTLQLPQTSDLVLPNSLADALALKDPRFLPKCRITKEGKKNTGELESQVKVSVVSYFEEQTSGRK